MIGIPLPNMLDWWGSLTGRCECPTGEKAVRSPSDRTCRSSFIIRSIREAGEEARELLSAEAGYRCEIGDRKQIRGSKRLMSGYDSERCPSIERYTKASGCHIPNRAGNRTDRARGQSTLFALP